MYHIYHIIYHTISYHITSYHIITYHIIPYHNIYLGICLTTEEKARKNLSQGGRRMTIGKEYTEQSILVNKNT